MPDQLHVEQRLVDLHRRGGMELLPHDERAITFHLDRDKVLSLSLQPGPPASARSAASAMAAIASMAVAAWPARSPPPAPSLIAGSSASDAQVAASGTSPSRTAEWAP